VIGLKSSHVKQYVIFYFAVFHSVYFHQCKKCAKNTFCKNMKQQAIKISKKFSRAVTSSKRR